MYWLFHIYLLQIRMAKNEKSSAKVASLAGKVLGQKSATKAAKSLAGSVLTQAPDKKSWKKSK